MRPICERGHDKRTKNMLDHLKNVRAEMTRVTWPSRKDTKNMSLVTIGVLTTAGFAIWLIDTALVAALALFAKIG